MPPEESSKSFNEHTLQIHYKPNTKMLDNRGAWTEKISKHMEFVKWRIDENRIDVFDEDGKDSAFVQFDNAGFVSHDVPTANYFPDKAVKLFKFVLEELDDFGAPIFVSRIGVREKFYSPFGGSWDDLCKQYSDRFLSITKEAKGIVNGKLMNVGGSFNVKDKHGRFNMNNGPMRSEQVQQPVFLNTRDNLPEFGLYCDIDYWERPEREVENQEVFKLISTYSKEAWDKNEQLCNLILGG